MTPLLLVLGLLMLGVAIVAWATRHRPSRARAGRDGPDTARNAPMTAPGSRPAQARPTGSVFRPQPDAFVRAPASTSRMAAPETPDIETPAPFPALVLTPSPANDPFAHAPALPDLAGRAVETRS